MSVSIRSMLVPGVALATVGAVALGPALVAPPAVTLAQPQVAIPVVYIDDIQLAGIGRDFYNSVSAVVQGLVQWAQWAVGIVPFAGSAIAAQIDLNYAQLIQPLIANTVYAVSDIIANPLGILTTAGSYVSNQVYVGYSWVASQVRFFGLPPILGPIPAPPPLASVGRPSARASAAARTAAPRAAAAVATPARVGRGELRGPARAAVVGAAKTARAAAVRPARAAAAKPHSAPRAVASPAG